MIIGNLATYPARIDTLPFVVETILSQVDRLNIVLNQFAAVPDFLDGREKVRVILPPEDAKDTGKFLPDTSGASWVFLFDDDFLYPKDYVAKTLEQIEEIGVERAVYSHFGLLYQRPRFRISTHYIRIMLSWPRYIFRYRRSYRGNVAIEHPVVVDELGTGVAVLRPELMPPFEYMRSAQRFVDVRLAQWCFENDITPICLAHPRCWLLPFVYDENIYDDFSNKLHRHMAEEICKYAFKVKGRGLPPSRQPQVGAPPGLVPSAVAERPG